MFYYNILNQSLFLILICFNEIKGRKSEDRTIRKYKQKKKTKITVVRDKGLVPCTRFVTSLFL